MDYKLKLKALLHDPIYKIWSFTNIKEEDIVHKEVLKTKMQWHEKVAQDIFAFLSDETLDDEIIKKADILASGFARIIVSPSENKAKVFIEENSVFLENAMYIDFASGKRHDIGLPVNKNEVSDVFKKLGELKFTSQDEQLKFDYLFLWRFLPEIFPWINTHPADSRAPNHSIYDHLVQTSAVSGCLQNNDSPAFLLLTLGPVQDFISSAKKTSDLWSGSYILSYLTYGAIELIMEELGPDHIIYPNLLAQPLADRWLFNQLKDKDIDITCFSKWKDEWEKQLSSDSKEKPFDNSLTIANIPNRFLAIVPGSRAKDIAKKCKEKIKWKLNSLIDELFKIESGDKIVSKKSEIKNQLNSFFNIYYIVLPWSLCNSDKDRISNIIKNYINFIGENDSVSLIESVDKYSYYKPASIGIAYSLLVELSERFLASRKGIRDYINIRPQEGKKCKICGEFSSIIKDEDDDLCGVCFLKRKFPEIAKKELNLGDFVKYPSTSELPTVKYKLNIKNEVIKRLKDMLSEIGINYEHKFNSVPGLKGNALANIDGQFLIKGTYRKEYFKREYSLDIEEGKLKSIVEFLTSNQINPPVYYAIIAMDGDEMGKWISGKKMLKVKDLLHSKSVEALDSFWDKDKKEDLEKILQSSHPMSPSFHNEFSRRLSNFALNDVKKIVENTYYGKLIYTGGDDVLAFLPVEDAFSCALELQKLFKEKYLERGSMSAGIVFVHHKYPLQLALDEVRNAEKSAKSNFGRNACCIKLLKNSGETRVIGFKWDERALVNNSITLSEFFNKIVSLYREDKLSSKFAYDFMSVVNEISEQKEEVAKEILQKELKRIYLHKTPAEKQDSQFLDNMLSIFDRWQYNFKDFANMFIVGRFISKNGME